MDKLATFFNSLKNVTFSRIFKVSLLLTVLLIFLGIYENRQKIYDSINVNRMSHITNPMSINLSSKSKAEIDQIVEKGDSIIGIQVVETNFAKNTRKSVYFKIDDLALQRSYNEHEISAVSEVPLFSSNEKHNQRIVQLINGEFICVPFTDTIASTLYVGAERSVKYICSVSIPPIYGKFSGYLNVYLKHEPKETEREQIRLMLSTISNQVYERDLR